MKENIERSGSDAAFDGSDAELKNAGRGKPFFILGIDQFSPSVCNSLSDPSRHHSCSIIPFSSTSTLSSKFRLHFESDQKPAILVNKRNSLIFWA